MTDANGTWDPVAALEEEMAEAAKHRDPLRADVNGFVLSLIKIRLRRRLSQAELAELTGMQQSAIARIEAGKGNPTLRTLLTIAKALGANLMLE